MKNLAVIVSVYKNDSLPFVKEALESLLSNQTNNLFDIYIQFDGSIKDDVKCFLISLANSTVFYSDRSINRGLAYSLNELVRKCLLVNYEYIARMDADDISMPDRLAKQMDYMMQHPDIDCLGTWAIEIDGEGNEFFRKKMPFTHEECLKLFEIRDCMIHPTVMFRRSYFEKAGLYPEDTYFGEDTMMWAKGFKAGCKFANLPEYLLKFRLDDNFFKRRRGWRHAHSILLLRYKVNRMLEFGFRADIYAWLYSIAKMMPESILNVIYKIAR